MKFFIVLFAIVALANAYYYNPEAEELTRYRRSYGGGHAAGHGGLAYYDGPHCKSVVVGCAPIVQKVPCKAAAPAEYGDSYGPAPYAKEAPKPSKKVYE